MDLRLKIVIVTVLAAASAALGLTVAAYDRDGNEKTDEERIDEGLGGQVFPRNPWPIATRHELQWRDRISPEVEQKVQEHFRDYGAIKTHPTMTYKMLGVDFEPIRGLPLATFQSALPADLTSEERSLALLEIFNIQIISPEHQIDLPVQTTLHIDFEKDGYYRSIRALMTLSDRSTYYFDTPTSVLSELVEVMSSIGLYPVMSLSKLVGFTFNDTTVDNMPPLGAAVTYNVRFGDVRIDTNFQWVGRPKHIPNGGVEFLR